MIATEQANHGRDYALSVRDVSHSFGGLNALTSVSLDVPEQSITALIGPNGAGKTTMFNIMTGVIKPESGHIFLHRADVTGWSPNRLVHAGCARTWQNIRVFPNLTVEENVIVGLTSHRKSGLLDSLLLLPRHRRDAVHARKRAGDLLERLGMYDKRHALPLEMSYGYRRRLEIARTLASDPRVLMLDEPTAGLRAREANDLMKLLGQLSDELRMTILLIEHNMRVVAAIAEYAVVLNFGKKIAEGPTSTVLADAAVIDAYLGAPIDDDPFPSPSTLAIGRSPSSPEMSGPWSS